jgi:hypothetical protein
MRGRKITPPEIRFWKKVNKVQDGCWLWTGATGDFGYGSFGAGTGRKNQRHVSAHRYAYELMHGPIPEGLYVLHNCDVPGCCRPSHLRLGTQKENIHDMILKGREATPEQKSLPGEKNGRARLNVVDVVVIRNLFKRGMSASKIAECIGILRANASKIVHRRIWKHIPEDYIPSEADYARCGLARVGNVAL